MSQNKPAAKPQERKEYVVRVEGHADSYGIGEVVHLNALCSARACTTSPARRLRGERSIWVFRSHMLQSSFVPLGRKE